MSRVIALANQKGGVGKTTTCVNLGASLALKKKVLVIDMDPQGNATTASGVEKTEVKNSVYDILVNKTDVNEVLIKNTDALYDLLPANSDLTAASIQLMECFSRESILKKAISKIRDNYDFILIDCPPTLNLLTVNALCAADSVLVPMQCEYFALEGITDLMDTIEQIKSDVNQSLVIEGVLRTMYDSRARLAVSVSEELKNHFKDKVYKTPIPRNIRLAESPSFGKAIWYYDKNSIGAKAYLALAGEILSKYEN